MYISGLLAIVPFLYTIYSNSERSEEFLVTECTLLRSGSEWPFDQA